ncbi:vWA domain-containing protein [Aporhodopirellula aestuarii]|uniref:von Willebrand factor type A domain-containing protein n=1 Tax=Aporhodopirellula aestuarii TaxID=2950107 RepID=A0ABT0TZ13_9BACT|nr:von Willebrand factor type A domain-containing protein [Aporhodopirellula aestuarii]MCM2369844.1 von Willebrand factor type A domain-containing protein [Aporhodopirellula aestuarii]
MNDPSQTPRIDPELEARIVALVLGESSDFEREQLNRLIAENTELAAFRSEMELLHGLMHGAATLETEPDDWKLPPPLRDIVLTQIDKAAGDASGETVVFEPVAESVFLTRGFLTKLCAVAALLLLAGGVGLLALTSNVSSLAMRSGADTSVPMDMFAYLEIEEQSAAGPFAGEDGAAGGFMMFEDSSSLETSLDDSVQSLAETESLLEMSNLADDVIVAESAPARLSVRESQSEGAKDWYGSVSGSTRRQGKADASYFSDGLQTYDLEVHSERLSRPDIRAESAEALEELEPQSKLFERRYNMPAQPAIAGETERFGRPVEVTDMESIDMDGGFNLSVPGVTAVPSSPTSGFVRGLEKKSTSDADSNANFSSESSSVGGGGALYGGSVIGQRWRGEAAAKKEASKAKQVPTFEGAGQPALAYGVEDTSSQSEFDVDFKFNEPNVPEPRGITGVAKKLGRLREQPLAEEQPRVAGQLQAEEQRLGNIRVDSVRQLSRKSRTLVEVNEKSAASEPFSTFSLHVSDVSFKLARAALASGQWPDAERVRVEEFVNAFDYGDPMPGRDEKVSCRVEQSIHPFRQQRNLLRVSMRTAAAGRAADIPLRLTCLLDNSGSMERIDRQETVRRAFALLAGQLKPFDEITLISFARQPRLLADRVRGDQSGQLVQLIDELPSEGGTNIEAALQLAFEKARERQDDNSQNRIVLLTDGAVNLGDADPESLSRMITTIRDSGISFDAAGIIADGLNDEVLESMTRQGDGRYYLLDSVESADDEFVKQIAGALRPSARNVKVQVEFNPQRVGSYRLLGFEKHRLKKEDFRNDAVDAAEMAAEEAGVAVYEFEAKPDGEGDVGSVSVRFQDLSTGQMVENRWPITYQADPPRLEEADPSMQLAASAALLATKLRGEARAENVDLKVLNQMMSALPERVRSADRVNQLNQMIQQAQQLEQ